MYMQINKQDYENKHLFVLHYNHRTTILVTIVISANKSKLWKQKKNTAEH